MVVKITGEAADLAGAFKKAGGAADDFGSRMDRIGSTLGKWGAGLTAGVTAPLLFLANSAIDVASDLVESWGFVERVSGEVFPTVKANIEGLEAAYGITERQATEFTGALFNQFNQLGFTKDQTAALSDEVLRMAGDWSSALNIPVSEVLDAIQASLRGEYDSLQRLIPGINAAAVEQEALAATGKKSAKELTANEKATATLAIVRRDSVGVAGDAIATEGTLAGQMRSQRVAVEDLQASIGEKLLPVKQKLLEIAADLLDKFNSLSPTTQGLVLGVAGLAAALGPLALVGSAAANMITFAMTPAVAGLATALWGLATNPVVLAVTAIALLAAGLVVAYQRVEGFRVAVDLFVDSLQVAAGLIGKVALVTLQQLINVVLAAAESFLTLAAAAAGWVTPLGQSLRAAREDVGATRVRINDEIGQIITEVNTFVEAHVDQAIEALEYVTYQANLLDGRVIRIRTVADVGNITAGAVPLQHGGLLRAGRLGLVGEAGPELVAFDRLARVFSNAQTRRMVEPVGPPRLAAAGNGHARGTVVNQTFVFPNYVGSRDELVAEVQRGIRAYSRRNGNRGI